MNPIIAFSKLAPAITVAVATVFSPVQAGVHDFNLENRRPSSPAIAAGTGNCYATPDKSQVCYIKLPNGFFTLAIHDKDVPGYASSVFIDCKTGVWKSYGVLKQQVLDQYMGKFCTSI